MIPQRSASERAQQLRLFESTTGNTVNQEKNGAGFHDPAFASNKTSPIHRWVPWIAGFSSAFVRGAIDTYLSHTGTVLDPFAGVGTTLVEAVLRGHDAVGFEINPYAALACRTKVNAFQMNADRLEEDIRRFQTFYADMLASDKAPKSSPPQGFRSRSDFYSPQVLRKVLIVQDFISGLEDANLSDLFRSAFAATMVRYSNYSYEPSLGRRAAAGKEDIIDFAVDEAIVDKLAAMAMDIRWFQSHLRVASTQARVINDSFFSCATYIDSGSVDLVITSPPYLNNYHYNRNTRPHLYWLGLAEQPKDFRKLEEANFGKFWQTVREKERVDLDFELPGTDLAEQLEELRGRNAGKGIYGGNGWANYAATYFNDCRRFAQGLQYSLRGGGTALVVIGNSILQGIMIPTDRLLGKIGEAVGLELVAIHVPRATRVGNSIIQSEVRAAKADDKHQLYEAVVELRKP